ncbi:hypothetical protein DEH69_13170 [Streptomyces sp. PT12]|nr:hypothetical protein DEH69_13170 [Streptomyces sp. PT12]
MDWWLRIRLARPIAAALALCALLGTLADSLTVPVPVLVGGISFPLPLPFLLPLLPVCLLLQGQARAVPAMEGTGARAVWPLDAALVMTCAAAALAVGAAQVAMGGGAVGIGMARNLLGYLGLTLLLQLLGNPRLTAATVALLPISCAAFGVANGSPAFWAWPLHEPDSLLAFTQASALFCAGLACTALPHLLVRPTAGPRRSGL